MTSKPRPDSSNILGVSMPLELKQRIKRLADAENRTMAKWTALKLREIVDSIEYKLAETNDPPPPNTTPEQPVKYPAGKRRPDRNKKSAE